MQITNSAMKNLQRTIFKSKTALLERGGDQSGSVDPKRERITNVFIRGLDPGIHVLDFK